MLTTSEKSSSWTQYLRILGLFLFGVLLWKANLRQLFASFAGATWWLILLAIALNIPQISFKVIRWRYLMKLTDIPYDFKNAILAYFGSIFIGLLTPGRLGEFIKIFHVSYDCEMQPVYVFSSVILDRLCDLYFLMIMGMFGLWTLLTDYNPNLYIGFFFLILVFALPVLVLFNTQIFDLIQVFGGRLGKLGQYLLGEFGWLTQLHYSLKKLTLKNFVSMGVLTICAYGIFYGQCYCVALSLNLRVTFWHVCFAVALGSLVTLLPVSISGLGTRDAAIIAYLGTVGVSSASALSFSLLIFLTFYIAGGIMGAIAWWIKPAPPYWKQKLQYFKVDNGT